MTMLWRDDSRTGWHAEKEAPNASEPLFLRAPEFAHLAFGSHVDSPGSLGVSTDPPSETGIVLKTAPRTP